MKYLASVLFMSLSLTASAETPLQILDRLQAQAGSVASPERGKQLYHGKFSGGKTDSCASCHTSNPGDAGRHARTNKAIEPLAPSVNRERFNDPEKVEKWFKRNCNDVLGRACTAQEKADFTAYILAQR
jgi:cytochrome c peroxidase